MSNEPIHELEGFCQVLSASGLLRDKSIESVVADFRAHAEGDKFGASLPGFTHFLVRRGLLTAWQCGKLRLHQYKGFFLDNYLIVDQLPFGKNCSRFVAENVETGQLVVLCAKPPEQRQSSDVEYWIEEFRP